MMTVLAIPSVVHSSAHVSELASVQYTFISTDAVSAVGNDIVLGCKFYTYTSLRFLQSVLQATSDI